MEAHWETSRRAPIHLFAIPDEKNERNLIEIGSIPGLLSFLGHHDFNAEVIGLKDIPKDERPSVWLSLISFRLMVFIGTFLILVSGVGLLLWKRLAETPLYLKAVLLSLPLPYVAIELGWVLAEVGRQPWIVYGLMRTSDAVSPVDPSQVLFSLIGFIVVYGFLGTVGVYLMTRHALKGPDLRSAN
jgi:cytochrome bd ubiquinol oxidase subunit I